MTLSLATRGYLFACSRGELPNYGPGPRIIGMAQVQPGIDGAAVMLGEAPGISGAAVQAPRITGAVNPTTPPAGPTPVIVGAEVVSPTIDDAEEE